MKMRSRGSYLPRIIIALWFGSLLMSDLFSEDSFIERKLILEEALFDLEVKGEPESALTILERLEEAGSIETELLLNVLWLKIQCHLRLGETKGARDDYQKLYELSQGNRKWLQVANDLVPSYFIHKEIPWRSGELLAFQRSAGAGELEKVLGMTFVSTELLGNETEAQVWSVKAWDFGREFHVFEAVLRRDSLELRTTQLDHLLLQPIERNWLGLVDLERGAVLSDLGEEPQVGWVLRGLLLQQCTFELGLKLDMDLFDLEDGFSKEVTVSVDSVELITLPDGKKQPCWITDIDSKEGAGWEQFAFSNDDRKALIQYRMGNVEVNRLNGRGVLEQVVPEGQFYSFLLYGDEVSGGDYPEKLFVSGSSGVRVYLGSKLVVDPEAYREVLVDEASGAWRDLQVFRVQAQGSGMPVGFRLVDAAAAKTLVIFGPESVFQNPIVDELLPYVELLRGKGAGR